MSSPVVDLELENRQETSSRSVSLRILAIGLLTYCGSMALVLAAVAFGRTFLQSSPTTPEDRGRFLSSLVVWDGGWYSAIAEHGYDFNPNGPSRAGFFPGYPMATAAVRLLLGCDTNLALVVTSNLALAVCFVLFYQYSLRRLADERAAQFALAAFAFFPPTFFFRMGYSESLLALAYIAFLVAIERNLPTLVPALCCGLATAIRPTGIALLPALALYTWKTHPHWRDRLLALPVYLWVGCWGINVYCTYLGTEFGEPTAYVTSQSYWRMRVANSHWTPLWHAVTFQSFVEIAKPDSPYFWANYFPHNPLFSITLANPVVVLIASGLLILGICRRWLTIYEFTSGMMLVAIPYVARAHDAILQGEARYMAVVVPIYLVMGLQLHRLNEAVATAIVACAAFLLGAYSAMFGTWYWIT